MVKVGRFQLRIINHGVKGRTTRSGTSIPILVLFSSKMQVWKFLIHITFMRIAVIWYYT